MSSLAVNDFHVENKIGVCWDSWLGWTTIGSGSWASNISFLADTEIKDSIFPTLDNSHITDGESNWLSSWNWRVEHFTICGESTGILNLSSLSGLALSSGSLFEYIDSDTTFKLLFSQVLWGFTCGSICTSSSSSTGSCTSSYLSFSLCLGFSLSLCEDSWIDSSCSCFFGNSLLAFSDLSWELSSNISSNLIVCFHILASKINGLACSEECHDGKRNEFHYFINFVILFYQ